MGIAINCKLKQIDFARSNDDTTIWRWDSVGKRALDIL